MAKAKSFVSVYTINKEVNIYLNIINISKNNILYFNKEFFRYLGLKNGMTILKNEIKAKEK